MSNNLEEKEIANDPELAEPYEELETAKFKLEDLGRELGSAHIMGNERYKEAEAEVKRCWSRIAFYNMSKRLFPIKDRIKEIEKQLKINEANDYMTYELRKCDNIRCVSFMFKHYNGKDNTEQNQFHEPYIMSGYDALEGYIIYDMDGNILSEKLVKGMWSIYPKKRGVEPEYDNYVCKFLDKEHVIILEKFGSYGFRNLFKLEKDKFVLEENLGGGQLETTDELTKKGLIIINGDKVYNFIKGKYVCKKDMGFVHPSDTQIYSMMMYNPDEDSDLENEIRRIIKEISKKNNLLHARRKESVSYNNQRLEFETILFLDQDGHIVSDLFIVANGKVKTMPVSDENYEEVLNKVEEGLRESFKKSIARKEAARKAAETRAKNQIINGQKAAIEAIKTFGKSYKPKKKKEEQK